jgi:hypothetical protein
MIIIGRIVKTFAFAFKPRDKINPPGVAPPTFKKAD